MTKHKKDLVECPKGLAPAWKKAYLKGVEARAAGQSASECPFDVVSQYSISKEHRKRPALQPAS